MQEDKKAKARKLIIIVTVVFGGLALLMYSMTVILDFLKNNPGGSKDTNSEVEITFFPPDYSENIFEDVIYTSYDRNVTYVSGGYGISLTENILDDYDITARFFYNYFNNVINGNYEGYPSYFTAEYIAKKLLPEKFTMQKIYDIEVSLYSRERTNAAPIIYLDTFEVRYKIRGNNGTFRSDVESDTIRPIVFELIVEQDNVKINDIYPIKTMIIPDE